VIGREVACWFDPRNSATVVLEHGYNWWMWLLTLLLPRSSFWPLAERASSARSDRGASRKSIEQRRSACPTGLPPQRGLRHQQAFPRCRRPTTTPILRARSFDTACRSGAEEFGAAGVRVVCHAVWNAVVVVLAVGAGLDLLGHIDWLLLGLLVPFVGVGIGGVVLFVRTSSGRRPSVRHRWRSRISRSSPEGGMILLAQGARGILRRLEVMLEVEEQATFRQGTDTRTERVVVWRQPVKAWRNVELSPGAPFQSQASVEIPDDMMHSFHSEHNTVSWRFVVAGEPDRWPPFRRVFPWSSPPKPRSRRRPDGERPRRLCDDETA